MPLHPARTLFDDLDPPDDTTAWAETLAQAFANPRRTEGFLAEAEKAERACPGDPTHSLSGGDSRPARRPARQGAALSQTLRQALSRPEKPYLPPLGARSRGPEEADRCAGNARAPRSDGLALCRCLVSRRLGTATLARRNRSTPVMGREPPLRARRPAAKPARPQARAKIPLSTKSAHPRRRQRKRGRRVSRRCRLLERLHVDIPLVVKSDLRPLLATATGQAESEGGWFVLRERLAHLGLAEGFDELLCASSSQGRRDLLASDRDRAQGIETVPRPRAARRRGRPRQDRRGGHGAQGVSAARHGRAGPGAGPRLAGRTMAGGIGDQIRYSLRDHARPAASRGPRALLGGAADHRFAGALATARACRTAAGAVVRSGDRRRSPPSARPRQPELQAGRQPDQAFPAVALRHARAEQSHRALQPADPAEARHLQDAEGISRRLHDRGQAAPTRQPGASCATSCATR